MPNAVNAHVLTNKNSRSNRAVHEPFLLDMNQDRYAKHALRLKRRTWVTLSANDEAEENSALITPG